LRISTICYSQIHTTSDSTNYKWEISLAVNSVGAQVNQPLIASWGWAYTNLTILGDQTDKSFSVSISPKFSIKNSIVLRSEFGLTNIYLISHFNGIGDSNTTYPTNLIKDDTLQQKIIRLAIGLQYSFLKKSRIEMYCGMALTSSFLGKMYWKDNLKSNNSDDIDRWSGTTPGGYIVGLNTFTGFKFRLCKRFAIGSEIFYGLQYYRLGGVQTGTREFGTTSGPITTRNWSIANNIASGFQFSKIMPSINISFQF